MRRAALILAALLGAVLALAHSPAPPGAERLPCADAGLRPGSFWLYCVLGRNYVRQGGVDVLRDAKAAVEAVHGPSPLVWLDASGPWRGELWPHRSHGTGLQIDLALYYQHRDGRPRRTAPVWPGYFAYEPPTPGERAPCGQGRPFDLGDPSPRRGWSWDAERTGTLVRAIIGDPRVERIFLEPHLADRLGLSGHPKVRFAGCRAARHDDHIHIDLR